MNHEPLDWDMAEDFYNAPEKAEKEEKKAPDSISEDMIRDPDLQKTVDEVIQVKKASAQGQNIQQISAALGLSAQYITDILLTIQGSPEDDELAVARLILMG